MVASPSSTDDGPVMLIVIGSLSEIVAVAKLDPFFNEICDDSVRRDRTQRHREPLGHLRQLVIQLWLWLMVCVAPAAELAGNVTVPDWSTQGPMTRLCPCPGAHSTPRSPPHPPAWTG